MTLIIANFSGAEISIESDTLLTAKFATKEENTSASMRLSPKVRFFHDGRYAVAAAGQIDFYYLACRTIFESANCFNLICTIIMDCHRKSAFATDFILACGSPPAVVLFQNGKQIPVDGEIFIGDENAYNEIVRIRKKIGSADPVSIQEKNVQAMQEILNRAAFPTIGGICLAVERFEGRFTYKERTIQYCDLPASASYWLGNFSSSDCETISFEPSSDKQTFRVFFGDSIVCEFVPQSDGSLLPTLLNN